jgi:hypothetical protein
VLLGREKIGLTSINIMNCRLSLVIPERLRGLASLALSVMALVGALCQTVRADSTNYLSTSWRFVTGDDPSYSRVDFDDSKWVTLLSGNYWENQGYPDYNGYAWYRQSVVIPSSAKAQADQYGGFVLDLGQIDDSDQTFLNGALIGMMGSLPPSYKTAYDQERVYIIPTSAIKWDAANVIAIRVYDAGGGGGLWAGTVSFAAANGNSHVRAEAHGFVSPDRVLSSDAIYGSFDLYNGGTTSSDIDGVYTLTGAKPSDEVGGYYHVGVAALSRTTLLDLPKLSLHPGFYQVQISVSQFNGQDPMTYTMGFAIDPEQVTVTPDSIPDLQAFWDKAKSDLAAQDAHFQATKADSQPYPAITVYSVVMTSIGNVRIRGWLGVPNTPGKHPGLLLLPGHGVNQGTEYLDSTGDFVSLAIDVRGQGKSIDDFQEGADSDYIGIGSPETSINRAETMDCVRALDSLLSRPGWP